MQDQGAIFIQRLNERQIGAYQRLYDEFYSSLVVYAFSFVESDEVAEDIVQELFITMWEKQLKFQSYPSFKTYLYRSIKNNALNHLKHQDVEGRYAEYLKEALANEDPDESVLNREESYRLLFQAIDGLPPRCREIFLLFLEGKQNKEVAESLQLSVETVKTQKARAITYLKKRLKSYSSLLYFFIVLLTGASLQLKYQHFVEYLFFLSPFCNELLSL